MQDNPQSSILTLHDAIADSPTYRSTAIHFDDQVDLLEKWLELLTKYMKQYVDKLNKFNLETNVLCKKVIPVGLDDSLIDPNFTGGVIKSFSDALQTSLAFKTKLVADLDDNFIQPLQVFIKTHLKEFKDFRKQHEKMLEKYETQLLKYTSQSKSKEASAVREEAFRLYEARKSYVHMSGQHVVRILHFRSMVEHFLVEIFSLATASHLKEFEGDAKSWSKLQSNLISWKQWLLDDKETCNYQLNQLQNQRSSLENKFLNDCRPPRDLEKYNITQTNLNNKHAFDISVKNNDQPSHKWGYLFVRGARNNWYRRWFFLYDGCFGSCIVNPSLKYKGSITLNDRVSVMLCEIRPLADVDRRYCFEVVSAHQPPFALQAENETEMNEWIGAFDKSKRLMLQSEGFKSNSTTFTNESSTSISEISPTLISLKSKPTTMVDESTSVSDTTSTTIENNDHIKKQTDTDNKPSIVMLSSSPENNQQSLTQTSSLTPLLVWEASRAQLNNSSSLSVPSSPLAQSFSAATLSLDASLNQSSTDVANQNSSTASNTTQQNTAASSSWGIPWALVPSMFQGGSSDDLTNELAQSPGSTTTVTAGTDAEGHRIVWPVRVDDSNVPKVQLAGYLPSLDSRNKELRHLFGGVSSSEVVLFDFVGLLKKKPSNSVDDTQELEVPGSPTPSSTEPFEQELKSKLSLEIRDPASIYGYAYTGHGFVTQETFWFYSCILMHCVNTIAIRLRDIKAVRLIRDASIPNTGTHSNLALAIDLVTESSEPLIITALMEDMEVVAEKLKFAVANAKHEPEPLQTTYDVISSLSAAVNKNKPSTQVKTIIKSATDPVRSTSDITSNTSNISSSTSKSFLEPVSSPIPSRSTDTKKKAASSKNTRKYSAPVQPKSGALAAAMMAASVAGGTGFLDARKGIQQRQEESLHHKKSKAFIQQEDGDIPIPLPNSTISSGSTTKLVDQSAKADDKTEKKSNDPHALPADFKAPSGPVSCGCDNHYDKLEAEIEVPVSAKHLYYMLFDETNPNYIDIWERKTVENKSKELTMTAWQKTDGKNERTLKYIIPVSNPMVKLKEAEVVEKQVIEKKDDYLCYVVLTSTKTAQLPYADAFVPYVKYCITWVSENSCKLCCYTGVKFLKNILVKGMVNKAAMKGMSENIAVFMPIIKDETSRLTNQKNKGTLSSLKRIGTIKRPSANSKGSDSEKKDDTENANWYDQCVKMLQEYTSAIPFTVKIVCAVLLVLYLIISWTFSGSAKEQVPQANIMRPQPTSVVSRAVYLRDVDEGLLHHDNQPAYSHSASFRSFMETKSSNRTLSTNYRWFSSHHHQFAIELLFSREKLAMLRHDTLVLFQLVNEIDAQLFENEYTNWLMDTRLQCRLPEADYQGLHCDEVKKQLKSFLFGTHPTTA